MSTAARLVERNTQTMNKFYTAFVDSNPSLMSSLYGPSATFTDPVFRGLKGKEPAAMWHMLLLSKKKNKGGGPLPPPPSPPPPGSAPSRSYSVVSATSTTGVVRWEARYLAPGTSRPVHNVITTTMTFDERTGLIVEQVDDFDLHKWCGMALGCVGSLAGGTQFFQNVVRKKARKSLDKYIASKPWLQGPIDDSWASGLETAAAAHTIEPTMH